MSRISSTSAFIYFLNFEERNLRTLWPFGSRVTSRGVSVNISFKIGNFDDLIVILISSLKRSLFFSLKPTTLYSTSWGLCLMRKREESRLRFDWGNFSCFLWLYLIFVIREASSGEATEHHSSSKLKMLKWLKSIKSSTFMLSLNSTCLNFSVKFSCLKYSSSNLNIFLRYIWWSL